jgi:hypothetical protein
MRRPLSLAAGSGAISKQGNTMVRSLLIETLHHAARQDPELRQDYQRVSSSILFHYSPPQPSR